MAQTGNSILHMSLRSLAISATCLNNDSHEHGQVTTDSAARNESDITVIEEL